ncbi:MAG: hypothetical protein NDJ90_00225 [Oligoflexia bacterium]|nr:hypothetical protein [Oligoflexia bacterium]
MSQIYATTDVDLNFIGQNGKTALTCLTRAYSIEGLSLLTRLKHGNLDLNALDQGGDGFVSAALGSDYCDEKCRTFLEQTLPLVGPKLDLEKHLIKGLVLTASAVDIELKMVFAQIPSFERIINAKDASGRTLLDSVVAEMARGSYRQLGYFNALLRYPQVDVSGLGSVEINLLSFPYSAKIYAGESEAVEYYRNLARLKVFLPRQLDASWVNENGDNLINLALKSHGEAVAGFLLEQFDFPVATLVQKNGQGLATCNIVFGKPALLQRLKAKGALTEECAEFEKEAAFANFDLVPLSSYPEMQKSFDSRGDLNFLYATNEKNLSAMYINSFTEDPDRIYVFDQSVWPLKLVKHFEFKGRKIIAADDIVMTGQGNVLIEFYECPEGRTSDCNAPVGGIDLGTLEFKVAPWRRHGNDNLYLHQGRSYYVYGQDFGQEFFHKIDAFTWGDRANDFFLRYFEVPQVPSEVLDDPHSVLFRRAELSFGGEKASLDHCFDADHCLAYDVVDKQARWFVLEAGQWRALDVLSGSFVAKSRDIVFPDSSYTVGWFRDPVLHGRFEEDQALIFDPVQDHFFIGKKRKEYSNTIPGTHWKVASVPTKFPLAKLEIRDLASDEVVSTCYAPEGLKLGRPLYFSKERREIQFFIGEEYREEPRFLRAQCG